MADSPIHVFSYIVTPSKRVSILPTIIGWPKKSSSKMSRSAVRCDDIRPLSFRVELRSRERRAMKLKKFSLSLGFLSVEASQVAEIGEAYVNWGHTFTQTYKLGSHYCSRLPQHKIATSRRKGGSVWNPVREAGAGGGRQRVRGTKLTLFGSACSKKQRQV